MGCALPPHRSVLKRLDCPARPVQDQKSQFLIRRNPFNQPLVDQEKVPVWQNDFKLLGCRVIAFPSDDGPGLDDFYKF
jgi:hypothetical protein